MCLAVERLPHQLKWREAPTPYLYIWYPPSFCDFCKVRLKWYTLIPFLDIFFFFYRKESVTHVIQQSV
uniref:prepilin peptidase n=1 Tax=Escherichia coli TaxID=562 RepID=UPI00203386A6|nr:prepilin peptidase [Escherichia coli]